MSLPLSACRWGSSFVEMVRTLKRYLTDAVSDVKLWVDIFAGKHASCPTCRRPTGAPHQKRKPRGLQTCGQCACPSLWLLVLGPSAQHEKARCYG